MGWDDGRIFQCLRLSDLIVLFPVCSATFTHLSHNSWLTYGEPLHRLREFGTIAKEMDLIDEAPLTMDEMKTMICHM